VNTAHPRRTLDRSCRVAIASNPRLARIAQPLGRWPLPFPHALFPIILLFLLASRGGSEIAAMLLMLLGTQWYILFNVIAGAMAIPTTSRKPRKSNRFRSWIRWRHLILPAIFRISSPHGTAWARVERQHRCGIFYFRAERFDAGLAAPSAAPATPAASTSARSTIIMATIVVPHQPPALAPPHRLASSRFKLET